ncbi:protein of unknown function [Pseudomonas sp. JV241A]|nr:protein of unknown function [Pseudomonas sp. JV241A]
MSYASRYTIDQMHKKYPLHARGA